jgi:hypothetical protein
MTTLKNTWYWDTLKNEIWLCGPVPRKKGLSKLWLMTIALPI